MNCYVISRRRYLYTQGMLIVRYGVGDTGEILKVYNVCVCVVFRLSLCYLASNS